MQGTVAVTGCRGRLTRPISYQLGRVKAQHLEVSSKDGPIECMGSRSVFACARADRDRYRSLIMRKGAQ